MSTEQSNPAFPVFNSNGECNGDAGGLTKREFFAAMALQGTCAHPELGNQTAERIAAISLESADALIEALNR